ncbi:MAG: hypothetical protein GX617_06225 [Lentisphaerae bacterium]|nr:hypothetical protein [Lentisphaerota bacterium]
MATTYTAGVGDGARSGDTVTRIWQTRIADADALFASFKHNEEYDDGYFNQLSSGIAYNEAYATLTMVFQAEPADEKHEDGDVEYSCNASTFERQLETLANYKTIWNHDLIARVGSSGVGSWDYAAEKSTNVPSSLQDAVKWSKDAPPDGWFVLVPRVKPGVEAYSAPAPVVSVSEYFKKRNKAAAKLRHIGGLGAPPYCFGYLSESKYWLINNSSMQRDGRLWVVVTEHIYAAGGWDEDIYQ